MGAAGGAVVVDGGGGDGADVGDHGCGGGGWEEGGGYDVRVGKLGCEDHRETRILWCVENTIARWFVDAFGVLLVSSE